jgi:hypothetical protein
MPVETTTTDDDALVRAIERAMAANLEAYAAAVAGRRPDLGVATQRVAGAVAAHTGAGSPLTTVKGLPGAVRPQDLDAIEAFFRAHGAAAAVVELAPWPEAATAALLAERGYRVEGHEDVLAITAPTARGALAPLRVEVVTPADWPDLVRAYEDDGPLIRDLTLASADLPGVRLAGIRDDADGRWIAAAQSVPSDDVVIFGNDGTHPDERGRGAQRALIEDRLAAVTAGTLVAAEVAPGSGSERNYLRCGFRVAYTRSLHVRALP